ncbi:acyl-CoA/acyl-ACP dehydrogenase [Rhizobium sp. BK068]|uniref:acyl-CoA/acyl-ACP dehydrogenase n=1 Tax=Rhizobium sp. BK068 TaxID=2512130 RepID=UPI00104EE535|nr:acyl-CoA/acyl-ACP dehydrogenase [Rhizobium sp. BK068]TCM62261.1 hypothetical protein EV291_15412 [Rhizobium sp. BK068]
MQRSSSQLRKAYEYVRQQMALGKPITNDRGEMKGLGFSHATLEVARALVQHASWVTADLTPADTSQLSTSKRAELEKWKREQQYILKQEAMAEAYAFLNEFIIPDLNAKHERAEQIINRYDGIMPRSDFRKILSALHPDNARDDAAAARLQEAFAIFKGLEPVLVKAPPTAANKDSKFPRTFEELAARKKGK